MESTVKDLAALAALFEQHRGQLLAMVRRRMDQFLAARVDPEDVLGDAFVSAQRRFDSFLRVSEGERYAWLYGVVLETLYESWRKENRARRDVKRTLPWPQESASCFGAVLADGGTSPSAAVDRRITARRVRDALSRLPMEAQEVLFMRHFDQLNHREAAQVLGLNEAAAVQRYTRALRKLRRLWRQTHGDTR